MKWSNEDIELLKELYNDLPNANLAKLFNRPLKKISTKARSLGLTKPREIVNKALKERYRKDYESGKYNFKGPNNPKWKGIYRTEGGILYVYKPDHPDANRNGRVVYGRLIAEELLRRRLYDTERVYRKKGNLYIKEVRGDFKLIVRGYKDEHLKTYSINK